MEYLFIQSLKNLLLIHSAVQTNSKAFSFQCYDVFGFDSIYSFLFLDRIWSLKICHVPLDGYNIQSRTTRVHDTMFTSTYIHIHIYCTRSRVFLCVEKLVNLCMRIFYQLQHRLWIIISIKYTSKDATCLSYHARFGNLDSGNCIKVKVNQTRFFTGFQCQFFIIIIKINQ